MPVLSLACHLPHNTPNIPSRYNNEQTTKQTKAINNSYIYISHVNVTQTVPDISPLMPMHQDPLLVKPCHAIKKGQIAGVWDAMTLMWRPRCISILNMVQNCICIYMYIGYCHFCGAFVILFCNYSVFQCRYHIFGVLVEAVRLVCTTENAMIADPRQWACGINTPGSFEMLSAVLV